MGSAGGDGSVPQTEAPKLPNLGAFSSKLHLPAYFFRFLKLLARRQRGLKMGLEQEEPSPPGLAMVEREMDVPIPLIFLINFH